MMEIRFLKTEADYDMALSRIDVLMDIKLGSPDGDELDVLVTLVEKYEADHYPIDTENTNEPMRFRMAVWEKSDG